MLEEVANGDYSGYRPQTPSQNVTTKLMSKLPAGLRLSLQVLSLASLSRLFRGGVGRFVDARDEAAWPCLNPSSIVYDSV